MINVEDWAEIRRLHRSEKQGIKTIARRLGLARNTVRAALAADTPPRYERAGRGSLADGVEPQIRALLLEVPTMPATVIAERIGWKHSSSILRAKIATIRPEYRGVDPTDRTEYAAGERVQCDLWFPPARIPLGADQAGTPPVLVMVLGFSRMLAAMMIPSKQTVDLLAGMWALLNVLGGVPKELVWDNETGIGRRGKLTEPVRAFAGSLGTSIYQVAVREPEHKGIVERGNQFYETSFLPGRVFTSPADFNDQLSGWLPKANTRLVRRTGARPVDRLAVDQGAMLAIPPVAPHLGFTDRIRLPRDYYVRVHANDYSVDPVAVGRMVDVSGSLERIQVRLDGRVVADHQRCWAVRQTITDPAHRESAARLRTRYWHQSRPGPSPATDPVAGNAHALVSARALPDYDAMYGIDFSHGSEYRSLERDAVAL